MLIHEFWVDLLKSSAMGWGGNEKQYKSCKYHTIRSCISPEFPHLVFNYSDNVDLRNDCIGYSLYIGMQCKCNGPGAYKLRSEKSKSNQDARRKSINEHIHLLKQVYIYMLN